MHKYSSSLLQPIFYKPIAFCEILQKVLIFIIFRVNCEMLETLEELGIQRQVYYRHDVSDIGCFDFLCLV
jgi:hypothetical protein